MANEGKELFDRFGVTVEDLRAQIKPVFLWMYDHNMTTLLIERDGKMANVTVGEKIADDEDSQS